MSDTSLLLEDVPTNALTLIETPLVAEALFITKASRAREISLVNIGANSASVDGVALGSDAGMSFAEEMLYGGVQRDYPDPLVVDATINGGTSIDVLIVY